MFFQRDVATVWAAIFTTIIVIDGDTITLAELTDPFVWIGVGLGRRSAL